MSITKSKLMLNPNDYSADSYIEEEENQKPIYIRLLIQLFMITVILGILIFSYQYFMKNYYETAYSWMMEDKVSSVVKKENIATAIGEEDELLNVEVEKKEVVKVSLTPKVEPLAVESQELTDEYIKLVEQSMGKY